MLPKRSLNLPNVTSPLFPLSPSIASDPSLVVFIEMFDALAFEQLQQTIAQEIICGISTSPVDGDRHRSHKTQITHMHTSTPTCDNYSDLLLQSYRTHHNTSTGSIL